MTRRSPPILALWTGLIVVLLVIEVAEVTHLFTIPIQSAIEDPLAFVLALVFTTILALVGAIFIGIYISHRILTPGGFTPFEEEMLRMRQDVQELKATVEALRQETAPADPPEETSP
ncbi:MAG TPA: hypothetical protein VMG81_08140 [Thermoplasmata archaeon]|nr:hypothetical protein [Thermoplasmata archaeon]